MSDNEVYQPESDVLPDDQQDEINRDVKAQALERAIGPEPKPSDFEDYDIFVQKLTDHRVAKERYEWNKQEEMKERARQEERDLIRRQLAGQGMGMQPQLTPMQMIDVQIAQQAPDDELLEKRNQLIEKIEHCRFKERKAQIRGDYNPRGADSVPAWQKRADDAVDELRSLGKSKAEQYYDTVHEDIDEQAIKKVLFNPDRADEPIWQSSKVRHDSAIVVNRSNQRSKTGTIRLPEQPDPWGSVSDCQPKHMMEIKLPLDQYEAWRRSVYNAGINETDHNELFKKSWAVLRKMGFADSATPVIKSKPVDPNETDDPSKMSWKRYVAWREQQEEKKRDKPRSFVLPKPRRGNG